LIESSVLIVSDEPMTSHIWAVCATQLRCHSAVASSAAEAIRVLDEDPPDLIVVDVTSRATSGVEICSALRQHTMTPLLLLTPINNETHSLEAYAAGADECIIKPVSPALFLAKSRVWLRRARSVSATSLDKLRVGGLTLDPARHQLLGAKGEKVRLSNLEFRMLYLLATHARQPFSTEEIVQRVWGLEGQGSAVLVKNIIYRLRKKIEPNLSRPRYLQTVTGGYLFLP